MTFYDKIKKMCNENKKVALFVDMDGTIAEYDIYPEGFITTETKNLFSNVEPIKLVIDKLEKISKIDNLDIYILSLSKSKIIKEEKIEWLRKNVRFIKEENYIFLIRENGDYDSDTRKYIKSKKMLEMKDKYDYLILLDDEHKILRTTQKELGNRGEVFHISSAII